MRPAYPVTELKIPSSTLVVPCTLMRGGTSRGVLFERDALPADRALWDLIFLAALGSPDVRQLDGVGAGDSHTSKIAVVGRSTAEQADVDYLFGEVSITEPRVDYSGNSGNLITAVGLYAVEQRWVAPHEGETAVRVRNVNTDKMTLVRVPVVDGRPAEDGDFTVDGVPGAGPRIDLVFTRPEGALTGRLFPTGAPCEPLPLAELGSVDVSLVDAANPAVLVAGEALGVSAQASVSELNADEALLARVQRLRAAASMAMGLVERERDAWRYSPMIPYPVLLFPPSTYARFDDATRAVNAVDTDLCVRVVSLGKVHKSLNVTMSVAVTAAARCPGTIAERVRRQATPPGVLRLGHPSGVIETLARVRLGGAEPVVEEVALGRSARRILQGELLVQPYKLRHLAQRVAADRA